MQVTHTVSIHIDHVRKRDRQ